MARVALLDPATAEPASAHVLGRIAGERGQAFNIYRALAHSPGALERVYGLAGFLWRESVLGERLVELTILRVAQLTRSDYEWSRHRSLAARAGVPDAQVEALARWRDADGALFGAPERVALALTDEATLGIEASAATVDAAREAFGERGVVELLVLIGLYGMVARVLRSLAVDPEPGDRAMP